MSVSILIISHTGVGNAFLRTLRTTFGGELPLSVSTVDIQPDSEPNAIIARLQSLLKSMDHGEGILMIADMFGATPCNIAKAFKEYPKVRLISGMNLPMLMRVMNYPDLSLEGLASTAVEGGRNGIIDCDQECSY